jgi:hypothetical protein
MRLAAHRLAGGCGAILECGKPLVVGSHPSDFRGQNLDMASAPLARTAVLQVEPAHLVHHHLLHSWEY